MKFFPLLTLSIFFFSCQQKENNKLQVATQYTIPAEKNIETKSNELNEQKGDTIVMSHSDEDGLFIAEGILDSVHSRIYVKFDNKKSNELKAMITTTTGKGNIRFNQIIFPDKTSDGPFGTDLTIPLKQTGNHVLVVGHSQMANDPYLGKFRVQLENKKD